MYVQIDHVKVMSFFFSEDVQTLLLVCNSKQQFIISVYILFNYMKTIRNYKRTKIAENTCGYDTESTKNVVSDMVVDMVQTVHGHENQ